jgi:hypothetical protein
VAAPTRGPETEGNSIAASGTCVRLGCAGLAGVVDTFPLPSTGNIPAQLSVRGGIPGSWYRRIDRASRWFSERRKRARLEPQ